MTLIDYGIRRFGGQGNGSQSPMELILLSAPIWKASDTGLNTISIPVWLKILEKWCS